MSRHKHLARLDSIWTDNPVFFITVCTIGRRRELANDEVHAISREVWTNCETRYSWRVGRYVLMPDHVHFFCWPITVAGVCDPAPSPTRATKSGLTEASYKPAGLSTFIGKWKEWTAKYAHRRHGIAVPLWQPEFFDHVLRSSESYEQKWSYVRDNPARAGLVQTAEDWPHQGELHNLTEL